MTEAAIKSKGMLSLGKCTGYMSSGGSVLVEVHFYSFWQEAGTGSELVLVGEVSFKPAICDIYCIYFYLSVVNLVHSVL